MADSSGPWLGVSWWIWGGASLVLAVVFAFVGPTGQGAPGWAAFTIRWGHSACWVLLAASFVCRALGAPVSWAEALALAGGACYLGFLVVWMGWGR